MTGATDYPELYLKAEDTAVVDAAKHLIGVLNMHHLLRARVL